MNRTTQGDVTATSGGKLFVALELSNKSWKLAFTVGGEKLRTCSVTSGAIDEVMGRVESMKRKFGLPADAPVLSCYEAGRDGFWIHRQLEVRGLRNVVVDSSSIEVDRRQRRAKTDRLDASKLVRMLTRHDEQGDVLRVVRVPTKEQEDERRPARELERLKKEAKQLDSRVRALLALHGVRVKGTAKIAGVLPALRCADQGPLPGHLLGELQRMAERQALVRKQIRMLEEAREEALGARGSKAMEMAAMLMTLRGIGVESATLLAGEAFAWREYKNGRQVGANAGLTGTPYDSGSDVHDQGISKAGNRRIRTVMIQLAWGWLRLQPGSRLARWYGERFAAAGGRARRIGIVALARKLLVALWRYVDQGVVPDGAMLKAA